MPPRDPSVRASAWSRAWGFLGNRYLLLVLRLVVGLTLIFSAVGALPHQAEFVSAVQAHGLLPGILADVYGTILPGLELLVGVLLVIGLFTRVAAGVTLLMVISFLIANGTAVYHNVKDWDTECGCFHWVTVRTGDALIIDIVLMVFALVLVLRPQRLLNLERRLGMMFRAGESDEPDEPDDSDEPGDEPGGSTADPTPR